jgi:hypothetical protein
MTARIQKIVNQVKALSEKERDELFSRLAEYEFQLADEWGEETAGDSQPGGRLEDVLDRVRRDILGCSRRPRPPRPGDA